LAFENLLGALWLILGVSREGLGARFFFSISQIYTRKKWNPNFLQFFGWKKNTDWVSDFGMWEIY
jgi:hypothetical protein